jgi:2-oxoglutarate ferredoxin oxidoreductase subunit alpha
MTPTSAILQTLAPLQEHYGFIYEQPEDEIAALTIAIGASFGGARSLVATAGGGFCLMTEAYGLAAMTETPVVIIVGMRGGPATGLPTWTEQADLQFVLHAHQGDFPRIVLAPGDTREVFQCMADAFNLADIYQCPVIVLLDKYLCESHISTPAFSYPGYAINRGKLVTSKQDNYARYALSEDGISPRSLPGVGNFSPANSDEHNTLGYSVEDSKNRLDQMNKRMQKITTCANDHMQDPVLHGDPNAPITIVSWGSNKGPICEALKKVTHANFLQLTWLNPFPVEAVTKYLKNAKHIVNLECNYSGQMGGYLREKTGLNITHNFLKYDGRPFYPEEIVTKLNSLKF